MSVLCTSENFGQPCTALARSEAGSYFFPPLVRARGRVVKISSALTGRVPRVPRRGVSRLRLATIPCPEGSVGRFPFEGVCYWRTPRSDYRSAVGRDGVSVYEFVLPHTRGGSVEKQFYPAAFLLGGDTQSSACEVSSVCRWGSCYFCSQRLPRSVRRGACDRQLGSMECYHG